MENFEFEYKGQKLWYSRSIVVSLYLYTRDDKGYLCILANKRGALNDTNPSRWNVPGGYLDFDETLDQCAERECFEETGVKVNLSRPDEKNYLTSILYHIDSKPVGHQNVKVIYLSFIPWELAKEFTLTNAYAEPNEVDDVAWLKMNELDDKEWMNDQLNYIRITSTVVPNYFLNSL